MHKVSKINKKNDDIKMDSFATIPNEVIEKHIFPRVLSASITAGLPFVSKKFKECYNESSKKINNYKSLIKREINQQKGTIKCQQGFDSKFEYIAMLYAFAPGLISLQHQCCTFYLNKINKKVIDAILNLKTMKIIKFKFNKRQLGVIASVNNYKKEPTNYILKSMSYSDIEKGVFNINLLKKSDFFKYKSLLPILFWNLLQDNVKLAELYEDDFFIESD